MLIAHLSDTHISAPGRKTSGVARMDENLRRCVDSINALRPAPDIVLHSGDVTNNFAEDEAKYAADILSHLTMPLFVVPGNHDDRRILSGTFGSDKCPLNSEGYADYVIEGYPVRIIALDTLDIGKPGGRITGERLNWLRARLDENRHLPTFLFAHHPPLMLGVPETDEDGFAGARALGQLVADYDNIERYLCGHIHLHTTTRWCGTVVTTAPATGMQLTLDLSQSNPSNFLLSDPAYLLHHQTPGRAIVSHHIQLSDADGPYPFSA